MVIAGQTASQKQSVAAAEAERREHEQAIDLSATQLARGLWRMPIHRVQTDLKVTGLPAGRGAVQPKRWSTCNETNKPR